MHSIQSGLQFVQLLLSFFAGGRVLDSFCTEQTKLPGFYTACYATYPSYGAIYHGLILRARAYSHGCRAGNRRLLVGCRTMLRLKGNTIELWPFSTARARFCSGTEAF